jgi:hypothetical protein
VGTGGAFPGVNWPVREADHSRPSGIEVNNKGSMPPLPHTSSWRGAQLIEQKKNSTFLCTTMLKPGETWSITGKDKFM